MVVKGGHAVADTPGEAVDVVWHDGTVRELRRPRVDTRNNHGSGCSFASATRRCWPRASRSSGRSPTAKDFVWRAVSGGAHWSLGAGHGPLDHFGWAR